MFPDSTTDMMPQTTMTTVSTGNQDSDSRIYLASDLEYAMIPVTDGSGHTVVQQVKIHNICFTELSKKETTFLNNHLIFYIFLFPR